MRRGPSLLPRPGSIGPSSPRLLARAAAVLALLVAGGLAIGCAARPTRRFEPAGPEEARRALAAWEVALERSDGLPSAKLLYDASLVQGLLRASGTLAVSERPGFLQATLAGPFGTTVAQYRDGALRGEGIRPLSIAPEDLRAILAGVWRKGTPFVAGSEGGDALLRWEEPDRAEAVLDTGTARLRSLTVSRPDGELLARYSGALDPWPEQIELTDIGSGNKLRLTLIAKEPFAE